MRRLLGLAALAALAGCSGAPPTVLNVSAPPPELEGGWVTYDCSAYGFTIAAPEAYKLTRPGAVASGMEYDPDAPTGGAPPPDPDAPTRIAVSPTPNQLEKGIVLVLYDQNARPIPGEPTSRMTVYHEEVGSASLEAVEAEEADNTPGVVEKGRVDLPIGQIHLVRTSLQKIGGETVTKFKYTVANGKHLYRFEFETANAPETIEPHVRPMMDTLRVTE